MQRLIKVLLLVSLLIGTFTVGLIQVSSAQSSISFDTSTSWVGQTNSVTLSIRPTGANELLLVGVVYNANYPSNPPASPGLTLHPVRHVDSFSGSIGINVNWAILPSANQLYSITVTYKNNIVNNFGIVLALFAGENTASPIPQFAGTKGTNSVPSQTLTPLSSADMVWAFTGSNSPTTQKAGQGFILDRQNLYYGSPADEYGFSSSSDSFGTSVPGTWVLISAEIQPSVTGQSVPVSVAPSTTVTAGSTLAISANLGGKVFYNPSYVWTASGCPNFVDPGSVGSFSYASTQSGTTTNCVFTVSVYDSGGDSGSGSSPTVSIINPVTGQSVPVNVSPSYTISAGSSLTVAANTAGLVFSNPTYSWTASGCPDFVSPGSAPAFSYYSTASGTTNNCVFIVSLTDNGGDSGTGQSGTVTVNSVSGQTVPVSVQPTTTAPAGSTLTITATISGLVFSNPSYTWSAAGCPNFSSNPVTASFSYVSNSTGTTSNCVFTVSVSDSYGNSGAGNSPPVTITSPATGQSVPVNVSPAATTTAGATFLISANVGGLVFSSPAFVWTYSGSCPDFINPGSVSSFSYHSTASGTTSTCVLIVSVSDSSGDTGSGQSATLTVVPATSQIVPVTVSPSTTEPAGSTLTVSANMAGLVFSAPNYTWTAPGCPDFGSGPGSVSTFSYVSTASGMTTNCVFTFSVSDSYGNSGSGNSPTVTITSAKSSVALDTSKVVFGQFGTKTIQIVTSQPNELILVGVGFNSNYQINTPTAPGLTFMALASSAKNAGASLSAQTFYAIAGTAQTYTITVGYASGSPNNLGIIVAAFYGINPSTPFDGPIVTATSGGVSSAPSAAITTTLAGDAIWAFQANANCVTQTAGTGYKVDQSVGCYGSPADEYSTTVSIGSQSVTFGKVAKNWAMFAVAIQDPPTGSSTGSKVSGGLQPSLFPLVGGLLVPVQIRANHRRKRLVRRSEVVDKQTSDIRIHSLLTIPWANGVPPFARGLEGSKFSWLPYW